jgi:hypothetical protein
VKELKKSLNGSSTLLQLLAGFLIVWLIFRKKTFNGNASIDSRIEDYLKSRGYDFGAYFSKVARLETGNYTSELFKNQNNLFGMRNASSRPNCQKGVANGFGIYESVDKSICDLADYLDYFKYPKSFPDLLTFATFLKAKGYYVEPLDKYYNALKNL